MDLDARSRLRASFASAVPSAGANSDCVQKYMAHAPTSVLTRHYAQISDEMLRAAILPAIEKWWHKSGTPADPSPHIQSNHGLASEPQQRSKTCSSARANAEVRASKHKRDTQLKRDVESVPE